MDLIQTMLELFILMVVSVNFVWSTSILFLCDQEMYGTCKVAMDKFPVTIHEEDIHVDLIGSVINSSNDFIADLRKLKSAVSEDTLFLIGFGKESAVNAVTCFSHEKGIPSFVYSMSDHRSYTYSYNVFPIHPDRRSLAKAVLTIIDNQMLDKPFLFCQDTYLSDGFLEVFINATNYTRQNVSQWMLLSTSISDIDLKMILWNIQDRGYRLLVLHSTPKMFERLTSIAKQLNMYSNGYAWIITESALPTESSFSNGTCTSHNYQHTGLLAIHGYEEDSYDDVIDDVIEVIRKEVKTTLKELSVSYSECFDVIKHNKSCVVTLIRKHAYKSLRSSDILYNSDGSRKNSQFQLLNLVKKSNISSNHWTQIGLIKDDKLVWPGQTIFGPSKTARQFFTIVTKPAEPFVYARGPVASPRECAADTKCLHIFAQNTVEIKNIVESFKSGKYDYESQYEMFCCEGIVVDLVHSLASELNFDFLFYFKNDTDYGTEINGSWSGMVNDVISGAADMMAGAISITSTRLQAVTFTEAFYFASYGMVAYSNSRVTSLLAFMSPFDSLVWIMIVVSATCVAIATSLFEWNSPFGLNPWGKRRRKNYTLGSALNMVYAMWFGHTVKTKSPKSWPTKRIGVIPSSAVEKYINEINPGLKLKKYYVNTVEDAFDKLRSKEIDLYADDSPLLEYALSKYDDSCSIKIASHSFGEGSYGIGFPKDTLLKETFDRLILNYVEHGYIEDFKWRYMGKTRHCTGNLVSSASTEMQFGWEHTHGLFVVLLGTIGLSVLLLALEHITYFVIVPRLKKMPEDSIWKSRNMEYFSQRLYKSINSQKVEPPAKVLLSKVRKTKFDMKTKMRRQTRSIPADMISYQMKNQDLAHILELVYQSVQGKHENENSDDVFTVTEEFDNDISENLADIITNISKHQPYRSISLTNGDLHDHTSRCRLASDRSKKTGTSLDRKSGARYQINRQSRLSRLRSSLQKSRKKRFSNGGREFYNPTFEADLDDTDEVKSLPAKHLTKNVGSRSMDRISDSWQQTSLLEQNQSPLSERVSFSKTDSCKIGRRRYETWPSPKTRKKSIKRKDANNSVSFCDSTGGSVNETVRIVNELPTVHYNSRTGSVVSKSDLNATLALKNNRFKSNLRDHAMSTVERQSHSMALDKSAVEALSKEDLLVLWKRSEIELQTRLNHTLHQNNHLRQLVHIAEVFSGQDSSSNVEDRDTSQDNTEESNIDFTVTRL
ncbi:hypothetical protein ACF0H5_005331 [Mactra antiquata]